ncbi:MAG: hypothetical protein ABJ251_22940 [Paracoccaceae bacterium]
MYQTHQVPAGRDKIPVRIFMHEAQQFDLIMTDQATLLDDFSNVCSHEVANLLFNTVLKVNIDALGAMRGKQAEIHRGSRLRYTGPPKEAGYTSAIATSKPEPNRPLQLGGVHIHPHMVSTTRDGDTQHWVGKALSLSNERWPKRALGAAQKRDRSNVFQFVRCFPELLFF